MRFVRSAQRLRSLLTDTPDLEGSKQAPRGLALGYVLFTIKQNIAKHTYVCL
jgi:hypothetical protein